MKPARGLALAALSSIAAWGAISTDALAQRSFPNRPIELVVPFSPGGGSGITGEMMKKIITEEHLSPQPVNITYKPGASSAMSSPTRRSWASLRKLHSSDTAIASAPAATSSRMAVRVPASSSATTS